MCVADQSMSGGMAAFQDRQLLYGLAVYRYTSGVDPAGLGILGASPVGARPDMICDPNANAPPGYSGIAGPGQPTWFNTSCFTAVPDGVVRPGNTGSGTIRGPGFANLDAPSSRSSC